MFINRVHADEVLVIHDIDSIQNPQLPMSASEFKRHAVNNDRVRFAPIVWCAETVALKLLGSDIDELYGNGKKTGKLLTEVSGIKKFKRTENTLTGIDVKSQLTNYANSESVNKRSLQALLYGYSGYSKLEAIDFLDSLATKVTSSLVVNGYKFDLAELKKKVPEMYRSNLKEFITNNFDVWKQYGEKI